MKNSQFSTSAYRIKILLWVCLSTFCMNAESNMTLHLKSGSKVVLPLESRPTIVFEHSSITIGNNSYQISDVLKYTIQTTTGLSSTDIDGRNITITDDGFINISNLTNNSNVKIYDTKGIEYRCRKTTIGNNLSINIGSLLSGNYILIIGNESIKFNKK